MNSILLIIPYFGKWPVWFDGFLISVAKNPTVNWLCPTDCELPLVYPSNIRFVKTNLEQLNVDVNNIVEANVPLTPRKLCDLKPAYGDIFKEHLTGYDFWGICDLDIIWGNIRKFITPDVLEYDIISSRKEAISGHFTLFKNDEIINRLYKNLPSYKQLLENPKFQWTDEVVLTQFLKENYKKKRLKVYWDTYFVNTNRGSAHQEYYLDRWQWQNGKMANIKTQEEVMYLHFINWKRTMKYSEVKYTEPLPAQFYISYNGVHFKKHTTIEHWFNTLKNLVNGYWVRMKRIECKNRFNHFKRKLTAKIK